MTLIYDQYLPIGLFLVVSTVLSCIVFGLSYVVASQKGDSEKLSAYECGFDPFEDTRGTFDVRFYLVAILFIIFDLEVTFLFPWSVVLGSLPALGFWSMFWFLMILTVGFIYEWQKGALEWELFSFCFPVYFLFVIIVNGGIILYFFQMFTLLLFDLINLMIELLGPHVVRTK